MPEKAAMADARSGVLHYLQSTCLSNGFRYLPGLHCRLACTGRPCTMVFRQGHVSSITPIRSLYIKMPANHIHVNDMISVYMYLPHITFIHSKSTGRKRRCGKWNSGLDVWLDSVMDGTAFKKIGSAQRSMFALSKFRYNKHKEKQHTDILPWRLESRGKRTALGCATGSETVNKKHPHAPAQNDHTNTHHKHSIQQYIHNTQYHFRVAIA